MRLKNILLVSGIILLSVIVFIINAVTKNVDLDASAILHLRSVCIIASFVLIYIYVVLRKRQGQRSIVKNIRDTALFAGFFLVIYLIISLLPLKGFRTDNFKLFPLDYLTIFFSSILSLTAGLFGIMTVVLIKDLILYKRKRNTGRNFWILFGAILLASFSALLQRPLEPGFLTGLLTGIAIALVVFNSFRLSWIAYLPRKEKIYALLFSLLAFFGFLAVLIIISVQDGWAQKGIHYYSSPLFTFVQLCATFGAIYFGMAFVSTLFHLPTAEAFDRKQTEISSIHNLNRLITRVFDLRELCETAARMVTEVGQASAVWLEIIDTAKPGGPADLMAVHGVTREELASVLETEEFSPRTAVIQSRKALLIDDIAEDKRTKHIPPMKKVSSLLVMPLLSHDTVIGILYATKEISYGFDQDDIDLLSGFADQVSIAVENARLITRSLEKERLQRELMLAQEMQQRLLPQRLPQYPGLDMQAVSSPALEVGGDYYDVVQLDRHRIGIVVGDVSGKGVGAAFYMAEVKGIFQSLATIYRSPKEFLIHANDSLLSSIDRRSFVSLIYAMIDTRTGELVMARAGHCPMAYISNGSHTFVKPLGLGLGLRGGPLFAETIEEKKIEMKKGDVYVFYTDGVTESQGADGEEFGYERLLGVIEANRHRTADEIKEAIVQTVWSYSHERGYHDDLTVFVVKWNGEPHGRNKAE